MVGGGRLKTMKGNGNLLSCGKLKDKIERGGADVVFRDLYPNSNTELCRSRYTRLIDAHALTFGGSPTLFSAPGRTELGGNHTDHQHGKVLCAAVDVDMIACASANSCGVIRVSSEGFPGFEVALDCSKPVDSEAGSPAALVRGIAAAVKSLGFEPTGLDISVSSDVPAGSGLSSSAAYEVLIGNIFNSFCCNSSLGPIEIARIGQFAENRFFGKPCGLMDQAASALGSLAMIDFKDDRFPEVKRLTCTLSEFGYALCIIDCGADHADLTNEYGSITAELSEISGALRAAYLRQADEGEFISRINELRRAAGDRAVLRAMHIFDENRRVCRQASALARGDFDSFLRLVYESGLSSWRFLQNVVPLGASQHQDLAFALALCERLLGGNGVCRVHGGGFAGTLQAFVRLDTLSEFRQAVEAALGQGACRVMDFRARGGCKLDI